MFYLLTPAITGDKPERSRGLASGAWHGYALSPMARISSMSTGRESADLYRTRSSFNIRGKSRPSKCIVLYREKYMLSGIQFWLPKSKIHTLLASLYPAHI